MAKVVIADIDDALEERLRARATRSGRTIEAEVYAILEAAAAEALPAPALTENRSASLGPGEKGLGDLMHERFRDIGLKEKELGRFNGGIAEFNSKWEMDLPDFERDEYEEGPVKR